MRYSPGEEVIVREDLQCDHSYWNDDHSAHDTVISEMLFLCGHPVHIKEITDNHKYRIVEFGCIWTDGMFRDGAEEEITPCAGFLDFLGVES